MTKRKNGYLIHRAKQLSSYIQLTGFLAVAFSAIIVLYVTAVEPGSTNDTVAVLDKTIDIILMGIGVSGFLTVVLARLIDYCLEDIDLEDNYGNRR